MECGTVPQDSNLDVMAAAEHLGGTVNGFGLGRGLAIAKAVGMSVRDAHIDSDGKLLFRDGEFHVLSRLGQTATRRNFSIAHEVGHWLVYKVSGKAPVANGVLEERRNDLKSRAEERLCDQIAANLLMPKRAVVELVRESRSEIAAVYPMSWRFGVSKQAALIRILECMARPALLIRWRPTDYDDPEMGLEVDWVFRSPSEELRIYLKQIPTPRSVLEFYQAGALTRTVTDSFLKVAPPRKHVQLIRMGKEPYVSIYALITS